MFSTSEEEEEDLAVVVEERREEEYKEMVRGERFGANGGGSKDVGSRGESSESRIKLEMNEVILQCKLN